MATVMGQSLTPKLAIVARRLGPSAGPRALEAHHVALTLAYAAEIVAFAAGVG